MLNKNNIKIACVFIGTLIGAGFASGKEITLFFGATNIIAPLFASAIIALLAFLFLEIGRKYHDTALATIFPTTHAIMEFFIALCNFFVFAAMLAGAEFIGKQSFGINGLGLLSGIFSLAVVLCGLNSIKNLNAIAVPLIVILIICLFIKEPSFDTGGKVSIYQPILYACMNILSGGLIIAKLAAGATKKDSIVSSAIIFVALTTLIAIIYLISKNYATYDMPILAIAEKYGIPKIGGVIIYLAIITTLVGALELTSNGNKYRAGSVVALGFLLSIWGFSNIVDTFYPIIGVVGVALSISAIFRLFCLSRYKSKKSICSLVEK